MGTYVQQLKEEYEKRLRVSERTLHGEKERRRQLNFHCKQLEAQLRKVQRDNESMGKQLKMMKKCASCSHLDQRSKSYNALNELLRGSVAALEPDAIVSVGRSDEFKMIKNANSNLQQCVDKLQSMLLKKGREALAAEKYYNNAISEREEQISRLQKEANQHIETKLKALLKVSAVLISHDFDFNERTELLDRINRLEKENKENYDVVHNEPQKLNAKQINITEFTNPDESDSNRLKQNVTAAEKIQKLSLALEMEKERNRAVENALKNENNNLSSSYQKLLHQCESLETELAKRRITEQSAKNQTKFDQNDQIASKIDACLISQLQDKLDKADKKIELLEKELALAKRSVYENEQFAITRQIEMLEKDKRELTLIIDNQTERLTRLEDQLRVINREKETLQRKYTELEHANNLIVKEKSEQLGIIERQRKELSHMEEKQIEENKAHDAQIQAYHQLIKQKDDERGALIAELCAANRLETPLYDPIKEIQNHCATTDENCELLKEVRELHHEKQTMLDRMTRLENELQSLKDQLRLKTDEAEKEVLLKNSIHDDLAKARTMLLEKEAQILDLNNDLKVAEVKLMKLETELANSADRLQVEQVTGSALKITVEELEDLLQEKNAELISAAQERQRFTGEMQKLKELKYDLETKLTLQGRELKEAHGKLAILRKKIQELELEAMNSPDKNLRETTTQQGSSKSTTLTTVTKSAISNTTPLHP
ncbi:hypothetical protein QQG55_2245 [Brugia pahangi]